MTIRRFKRPDRSTRAQTLQDFAIGISIFLLAFMFVLSLFPGLLTPFQAEAGGSERAQAEKVSTTILANLSAGPQQNDLNETALATLFDPGMSERDLLQRYGLPSSTNVNITVETLNGTTNVYTSTNEVGGSVVATSSRLVTIPSCDPACRLVVRVW